MGMKFYKKDYKKYVAAYLFVGFTLVLLSMQYDSLCHLYETPVFTCQFIYFQILVLVIITCILTAYSILKGWE